MPVFTEVTLSDIPVMMVISENGLKGSVQAFDLLESKLPTLKKRRFYGVVIGMPPMEEYRACVGIMNGDDPARMGLTAWTIPGGKYAKTKIKDWESHIEDIGKTFREMSHAYPVDDSRLSIEFYRSRKELYLFLPVV